MDVFRFDSGAMKSVLAYPENCQGCGQCYVGCQGRSLTLSWYETRFAIPGARAVTTATATKADVDAKTIATPAEAEAAKAAEDTK
jgi:ferredoxin